MNFKTTVALIALLVVAFGVLWFTTDRGGGGGGEGGTTIEEKKQKLFDVAANDVNKLVITAADGRKMTLEKSGGAKWRMLEPVAAAAESFEVDSLVRALADLESRGQV